MATQQLFTLIRIAYGFNRLNAMNLVVFVRNVLVMLAGNVNYLDPLPPLADITVAVNALAELAQKALTGDRVMIAARDSARITLAMMVRNLAAYVQANCLNSLAILLSSGFNAVNPVTRPNTPTNTRLQLGAMSGSLLFRFKKDRNVRNCSVQTATASTGPWTDKGLTTKSTMTLDDLPTMAVTYARVCANGAGGSSEWSEPTSSAVI